mgnify:CR=1 FL=1
MKIPSWRNSILTRYFILSIIRQRWKWKQYEREIRDMTARSARSLDWVHKSGESQVGTHIWDISGNCDIWAKTDSGDAGNVVPLLTSFHCSLRHSQSWYYVRENWSGGIVQGLIVSMQTPLKDPLVLFISRVKLIEIQSSKISTDYTIQRWQ